MLCRIEELFAFGGSVAYDTACQRSQVVRRAAVRRKDAVSYTHLQLCAWECTYEQEILFVVENLAALSERTWSVRRKCGDEQFYQKLQAATSLAVSLL